VAALFMEIGQSAQSQYIVLGHIGYSRMSDGGHKFEVDHDAHEVAGQAAMQDACNIARSR